MTFLGKGARNSLRVLHLKSVGAGCISHPVSVLGTTVGTVLPTTHPNISSVSDPSSSAYRTQPHK